MKRLLFAFVALTALVTSALAQRNYDNLSVVVVYTTNQTLDQNLASLNAYIDENIEPNLEYDVTAMSDPFFDMIFGFRMVRFVTTNADGTWYFPAPDDYRIMDGLEPFWAAETPLNVTAVYTNDFGGYGDVNFDVLGTVLLQTRSTTATVQLFQPAPAGGLTVQVRASNGAVKVPTSIRIPAGRTSATFTVKANRVSRNTNVTITVTVRGQSYSDGLQVRVR